MDGFKGLLASKTFWGALVALVAQILSASGVDISAFDQPALVNHLATFGGIAYAIYGRAVATHRIGSLLPMPLLLAVLVPVALGGCAGAVPWNDQNDAGITRVDADFNDAGAPKSLRVISGKEGQSFDVLADVKAGTMEWHAKDVRAFDAAKARAAVEQAVSSDTKAAAPGIVASIVDALVKAFAPIP
jgi:hypothetical protein